MTIWTARTIWELGKISLNRLLVIGAGPIGVELGQAFHRLGADVTIAQRSGRILTKEDTDVSEQILGYLREEGITIRLNTNIAQVVQRQEGISVTFSNGENETTEQIFDKLLIAAGRAPNVEGLELDKIGVQVGTRGIEVNNKLQTNIKNIYAAGDVIGHYLFTTRRCFSSATTHPKHLFSTSPKRLTILLCRGRLSATRRLLAVG